MKKAIGMLSGLALFAAVLMAGSHAEALTRITPFGANTWRSGTDFQSWRSVTARVMRSTQNPHNVLLEPTAKNNSSNYTTRVSISCWTGGSTGGWITANDLFSGITFIYCNNFQNTSTSGWGEIDQQ